MGTTKNVSANLRAIMAIQKKTVSELAVTLGVTRQTAGLYFNGHRAMTTDHLAMVADWLNVEAGELFRENIYSAVA